MRPSRPAVVLAAATLLAACSSGPTYATVDDLFAAAGGEEWCGADLTVTIAPFVGNCGDPLTDGRVVLGVGDSGEELRTSIDRARELLVSDGQLLLVPDDPDGPSGWQLRTRDRALLEAAQERIGGTLLDTEQDIDAWLGTAEDG